MLRRISEPACLVGDALNRHILQTRTHLSFTNSKITHLAVSSQLNVYFINPSYENTPKFYDKSIDALTIVFAATKDAPSPPKCHSVEPFPASKLLNRPYLCDNTSVFRILYLRTNLNSKMNRVPHWRLSLDWLKTPHRRRKVVSFKPFRTQNPPKRRYLCNNTTTFHNLYMEAHLKTTTNRMPHWRLPLDRLLMTTCCRKVISLDGFPTPKRLDRPYRHNNMSHFQVLYVGAGLNSMKNWLILWQELYLLWRMMCHHRRNAITVEPFPAKHYATCRISATTSLFSESFALERA